MQVLIHLGLNKCASTYIQHALAQKREKMMTRGVSYPGGSKTTCHYGISKHYGFGPDVDALTSETIADYVQSAKSRGCSRLILSSEYLSLHRPKAASHLIQDLELCGCDARFLFFSRDLIPWVHSLFNQYVRTVEGGRYLRSIDDFVDQVLRNRAIDIATRYRMWAEMVGEDRLTHYRLSREMEDDAILRPFSEFAGMTLTAPEDIVRNSSINPNALFRIGQLRSRFRTEAEEAELSRLLSGEPCAVRASTEYMQISPDQNARIQAEFGGAYDGLPYRMLDHMEGSTFDSASCAA